MATTYYGCFQSTLGGVRGAIGNVVAYSNVKTLADCKSSCAAASEGSAANTYNYARSYGTTSSAAGRMLCSCFKASSLPNLSADSCSGCTYLIGSSPTEFTASDFASSQCGNYNANVTSTGERYTFAIYTVDTTTTTSWSSSSSSSSSTTWNPSTSTTSSTPSSSDSPTTSSPSGTGTSSGITTGTGGSTTSGSTSTSPTSTGSGAGSGNDGKGSGNPSDQSSSSSSGISTGAIGGIVGGIGLLLIAVAAVYFFVLRPKWNQQRQADKKELMSSIFVNSGSGGSGGRGPGSGGSPQTSNSPPNQWSSPNSSEYQPGHGSNQPSSNPSQRWSNPTGEWQPQSGYGAGQPGVPNGGQMAPQPGFGAGQPGAPNGGQIVPQPGYGVGQPGGGQISSQPSPYGVGTPDQSTAGWAPVHGNPTVPTHYSVPATANQPSVVMFSPVPISQSMGSSQQDGQQPQFQAVPGAQQAGGFLVSHRDDNRGVHPVGTAGQSVLSSHPTQSSQSSASQSSVYSDSTHASASDPPIAPARQSMFSGAADVAAVLLAASAAETLPKKKHLSTQNNTPEKSDDNIRSSLFTGVTDVTAALAAVAATTETLDKRSSGKIRDIHSWTAEEVGAALRNEGIEPSVVELFVRNQIDGVVLETIDSAFLASEMGVSAAGVRSKVMLAVRKLRGDDIRRPANETAVDAGTLSPPPYLG